MGIDSLLQFLKPITDKDHISKFAGKRAAIDASSWLYRACYGCSYELNMGIKTYGYLHYFQKLINLLQEYKITPIIVFDGKFLPAKEKTQQKRSGEKSKNREKAKEALDKGNISEARKWFTRCISITDDITFETQDYLKKQGIEIIVAPYEADAQISYLIKDDYADFVIAEDSDLIAYGCKLMVYKLNSNGYCDIIDLDKWRPEEKRKTVKQKNLRTFLTFDLENIQYACIFSGCDYLDSIKSIGINKAVDFLKKQKTVQNVVNSMRYDSKIKAVIPKDYQHSVIKVSKIFKFQRVYEPFSQQLTTLNPIPQDFQEHTLIGLEFDQVVEFAQGMIHPKTHQKREEKIINLDDIRKTKPQYSNFNQNSKNNVNNYQQPQIIEPQVQAQYQSIIQNNILPENDLIEVALNDQNEEQAQIMIEQFKKYDEIKNEQKQKKQYQQFQPINKKSQINTQEILDLYDDELSESPQLSDHSYEESSDDELTNNKSPINNNTLKIDYSKILQQEKQQLQENQNQDKYQNQNQIQKQSIKNNANTNTNVNKSNLLLSPNPQNQTQNQQNSNHILAQNNPQQPKKSPTNNLSTQKQNSDKNIPFNPFAKKSHKALNTDKLEALNSSDKKKNLSLFNSNKKQTNLNQNQILLQQQNQNLNTHQNQQQNMFQQQNQQNKNQQKKLFSNKKDNQDNSSIYNNQIGKRKPEIIPKQKNSLDKYIIKVNKNAPN